MTKRCFVNSLAQISCHEPLCEEWMNAGELVDELFPEGERKSNDAAYKRSVEPDYREFFPPAEARRMSRLLKRAICTSIRALRDSGIHIPEAIITGTGAGCMENSEKFLKDMAEFGESCLKPTLFMQSTHNTISSLIAMHLKCHGYNTTYSHNGISFESALLDAWIRVRGGMSANVLLGAHDEVTPLMSRIMQQAHSDYNVVTEASMSALLSNRKNTGRPTCEITDVRLFRESTFREDLVGEGYSPEHLRKFLSPDTDPILIMGCNGIFSNDAPYRLICDTPGYSPVILNYRNIFGDNYSSSAMGFYAACKILETGKIPPKMIRECGIHHTDGDGEPVKHINPRKQRASDQKIDRLTLINHSDSSDWSVIRLRIT